MEFLLDLVCAIALPFTHAFIALARDKYRKRGWTQCAIPRGFNDVRSLTICVRILK